MYISRIKVCIFLFSKKFTVSSEFILSFLYSIFFYFNFYICVWIYMLHLFVASPKLVFSLWKNEGIFYSILFISCVLFWYNFVMLCCSCSLSSFWSVIDSQGSCLKMEYFFRRGQKVKSLYKMTVWNGDLVDLPEVKEKYKQYFWLFVHY